MTLRHNNIIVVEVTRNRNGVGGWWLVDCFVSYRAANLEALNHERRRGQRYAGRRYGIAAKRQGQMVGHVMPNSIVLTRRAEFDHMSISSSSSSSTPASPFSRSSASLSRLESSLDAPIFLFAQFDQYVFQLPPGAPVRRNVPQPVDDPPYECSPLRNLHSPNSIHFDFP